MSEQLCSGRCSETGGMCGCCETAASPTPLRIENRPGLSAVAYRVGTFAAFREAMLRAIGREPALSRLTTRLSDDPAITVLELWAAVADVLTFYQERIANESFLRTAVHRDSVLRLVRMLDYHLRPGLAATARLVFTVEKVEGVESAVIKVFKPYWTVANQELENGVLPLADDEIARLDNDPSLPENGVLRLTAVGGL